MSIIHHASAQIAEQHQGATAATAGRHRADRGGIRIQTVLTVVWLLATAAVIVAMLTGRIDTTPPCQRADTCQGGGESAVFPTPSPGAPPAAPHAGWPGSERVGR